MDQLQLTFN